MDMRQMPPNQVVSMQVLPGALSAVAISGAGMGEACGLREINLLKRHTHGTDEPGALQGWRSHAWTRDRDHGA